MSATTEDVQIWIDEAMKKRGIDNYKLDISGSSTKGDGYLGEISFVKVVADFGKLGKKVYEMVIKSAKDSDQLREKSPIAETYLREIFMYMNVFPEIEDFQKAHAIENAFKEYPKCYSSCSIVKKEALILKNLKSMGYENHDRTIPQNLEHVLFVFRSYAKWHGASMALKTKKPEIFKNLTKNMTDLMGDFILQSDMVPMFESNFQFAIDLLKKNGKLDDASKIQKECNNILDILSKMTIKDDIDAASEAVILHGDCWNNNIMFKYKKSENSKPDEMVFIDFQISRVASPILDLSYYLYACADKSTLDKLDYLLEEYYEALKHYLKQYDIDSEELLTLQRLKSSWRKYARFGLAMSPFILRIELCQPDEVIDFTELIGDGAVNNMKMGPIAQQKEYERRLYNLFKHYAEKCL